MTSPSESEPEEPLTSPITQASWCPTGVSGGAVVEVPLAHPVTTATKSAAASTASAVRRAFVFGVEAVFMSMLLQLRREDGARCAVRGTRRERARQGVGL